MRRNEIELIGTFFYKKAEGLGVGGLKPKTVETSCFRSFGQLVCKARGLQCVLE